MEAAVKEQDRKDKEKVKGSKSSLLFPIIQPQVLEVEEPEPVAEDGGKAENQEENERRSFPRH